MSAKVSYPFDSFDLALAEANRAAAPLLPLLRVPDHVLAAISTGPQCVLANLVRLIGPLPGSESHHDARPYGLLHHSIAVAVRAATLYLEKRPGPATAGETTDWQRSLVTIVLAALVHDLGKLWTIDVSVQIGATDAFRPCHRYLYSWAEDLQRKGASITHLSVAHRHGRTRLGPSGHEPMGLFLLPMVVPLSLIPWLGLRCGNDLVATLAKSLGASPSDPVFGLVKTADAQCVHADRQLAADAGAIPSAQVDYLPGRASLAQDWVQGARAVAGILRLNVLDGHALVGPSHTIIWLTAPAAGQHLLRIVFDHQREQVRAAGLTGLIRAYYDAGNPFGILTELASQTSSDGRSWAILARQTERPALADMRHFAIATDGRKTRKDYAILLRNDVLWGNQVPKIFTGQVALLQDDRRTISVDALDVGFHPLEDAGPTSSSRASRSPSIPIGSLLPTTEVAPVQDIGSVVARIAHLTSALAGPAPTDQAQESWDRILGMLDGPLSDQTTLVALEAIADRLSALSSVQAHQPTIGRSAPVTPPPPTHPAAAALAQVVTRVRAEASDLSSSLTAAIQCALLPDGTILALWPQCLEGFLEPSLLGDLRGKADQVADLLHLPPPAAWIITGYPYRGLLRQHTAIAVPPTWSPDVSSAADGDAPLIAFRVEARPV